MLYLSLCELWTAPVPRIQNLIQLQPAQNKMGFGLIIVPNLQRCYHAFVTTHDWQINKDRYPEDAYQCPPGAILSPALHRS